MWSARAAAASGQLAKAEHLCNQALDKDPFHPGALEVLGGIAAQQGRLQDAESYLRRAAAADPSCYDAARWLTSLLIGKNGGAEAVEFGISAVTLRPNEAEAHVILGLAAMGNGDNSLAIRSFLRAIELNPQMSGAYHNLGVAFQRDGNLDESIEAFQQAIQRSPTVMETYLHLGRSFLSKNLGDDAMRCARRALELKPASSSALRLLGDASFAATLGENGESHILEAIQSNPQSSFPHALMASRLQEQGKFDEAESSILRSMELQPNQGIAYYLLAHNRKIRESDRFLFEKVEPLSAGNALHIAERRYLNFALGKAYDDLGEYERAIRHFDWAHTESEQIETPSQTIEPTRHESRVQSVIELFTKEFLEQFKGMGLDSEEPIFIFGMPRSGTTLLEQILSRHSSVGAAGEQPFWRDSGRKVVNLYEGILDSPELQRAGQRYLELIRSIAPGKAHVTDKFPSNYVYLGLLHLVFPNAHFIHARRHPVDTCLSIYMRPFFSVQEVGRSRRRIAETYRLYRECMAHWSKTLPESRFLDVDYERLVDSPEEITREIVAHCGLPWEDACLQPEKGDRRVVTFSKWQVRQPVYKTSVERWRNYEPWLAEFTALLDP